MVGDFSNSQVHHSCSEHLWKCTEAALHSAGSQTPYDSCKIHDIEKAKQGAE